MTTDRGRHGGLRWRLLAVAAAAAVAASSFSWAATRARAAPDEAADVMAMQQALETHQGANRAATRRILEVLAKRADEDATTRAFALAEAVSAEQAALLGLELPPPPGATHTTPSEAVTALLAGHDAVPEDQHQALAALDQLPSDQAVALARVIDAFAAFEHAATAAFASAKPEVLERLKALAQHFPPAYEDEDAAEHSRHRPETDNNTISLDPTVGAGTLAESVTALREAGIDLLPIFSARAWLLDASRQLKHAFPAPAPASASSTTTTPPVRRCSETPAEPALKVPGIVAIDANGEDNCYTNDYRLIVDVGGADVYENTAGGNGGAGAAALVDLAGDDRYSPIKLLKNPVNGTVSRKRRGSGVNGGAVLGAGFLLDAGGNDAYQGTSVGVNGAGSATGAGFLLDTDGDDSYIGGGVGVNGGGAFQSAHGLLVDGSGDDSYEAWDDFATNGGAIAYLSSIFPPEAVYYRSTGFVVDADGADTYRTEHFVANGSGYISHGFLLDAGEANDTYETGDGVTNGGGALGTGFLYDAGGSDSYRAGSGATNGGAVGAGSGLVYDAGGDDRYVAGDDATNGGAMLGGAGALVDGGGRDSYTAGVEATNGAGPAEMRTGPMDIPAGFYVIHVPSVGVPATGSGLLLDVAGSEDHYSDRSGNRVDEIDHSEIPKGHRGAQVDGCHTDNPEVDNLPLVKEHCQAVGGEPSRVTTTTTTTIPPTTTTSIPNLNDNCQVGQSAEPQPASATSPVDGGWVALVVLVMMLAAVLGPWVPGQGRRGQVAMAGALLVMVGAAAVPVLRQPDNGEARETVRPPRPRADLAGLPLRFDANVGQAPPEVRFMAHDGRHTMFLTPQAVVSVVRAGGDANRPERAAPVRSPDRWDAGVAPAPTAITMAMVGAERAPVVVGIERLEGVSNYLTGNDPSGWRRGVSGYRRVAYRGVWPGIDMVVHADAGAPQYDMVVAPGADPANVRLRFSGQRGLGVDEDGNLVLDTALGAIRQRRPVIYQEEDGQRRRIAGGYVVDGSEVRFRLGAYDRTRTLVIDPTFDYSGPLGGTGAEDTYDMAVDDHGYAYVVGTTTSEDFPVHNAVQPLIDSGIQPPESPAPELISRAASYDAFVAKFMPEHPDSALEAATPQRGCLAYATYLGGSDFDHAYGVDVGACGAIEVPRIGGQETPLPGGAGGIGEAGCAYVTGSTSSTNFPGTPPRPTPRGNSDAFVVKLSPDGASLDYATYLGGGNYDRGRRIVADGADPGVAYVAGETHSADFPTTSGTFDETYDAPGDLFVTKLDTTQQVNARACDGCPDASINMAVAGRPLSLQYSTLLGGSGEYEWLDDLAVDGAGNTYLVGGSVTTDFPVTHELDKIDRAAPGFYAWEISYLVKLDADGAGLGYSTFLGHPVSAVAVQPGCTTSCAVHLAGGTERDDFPVHNALQPGRGVEQDRRQPRSDATVQKVGVDASGAPQRLYATYLGGSADDGAGDIRVDAEGSVYVTGTTHSDDFPVANAVQPRYQAGEPWGGDAFAAKLLPSGQGGAYSTYLGGARTDRGVGIAADARGRTYVAGTTHGHFPTALAVQADGGGTDSFLARIPHIAPSSADLSVAVDSSAASVVVDADLAYRVTVTNRGPHPADGVSLLSSLPARSSLIERRVSQGRCRPGAGTVFCQIGTVAPGASVQLDLIVVPRQPGEVVYTASAFALTPDPSGADRTASVTTAVADLSTIAADLSTTVKARPEAVRPGEEVTFVAEVRNGGPRPATSVVVSNRVPAKATLVSATAGVGSCAVVGVGGDYVECAVGDLPPGGGTRVTLVARVGEDRPIGAMSNAVWARGTSIDVRPANDSATALVDVTGEQRPVWGYLDKSFNTCRPGREPTSVPSSSPLFPPTVSGDACDGMRTHAISKTGGSSLDPVVVQPDGKVVAVSGNTVVRVNPDGSFDEAFGVEGKAEIADADENPDTELELGGDAVVQPHDGKILLAGARVLLLDNPEGTGKIRWRRFGVVRLLPDGRLDESFGDRGVAATAVPTNPEERDEVEDGGDSDQSTAFGVALQRDNMVVVAGTTYSGREAGKDMALARFDENGELDPSFGADQERPGVVVRYAPGEQSARRVAMQGWRIVVGGVDGEIERQADKRRVSVLRWEIDGSFDHSFNEVVGPLGSVLSDMEVPLDGRIVVAGSVGRWDASEALLAQYSRDGERDEGFGEARRPGPGWTGVAVQPGGGVLAVGGAREGGPRCVLARYTDKGTPDPDFGEGGVVLEESDRPVSNETDCSAPIGVALAANGRIVTSGVVETTWGLYRYRSNGTRDTTFGPRRDGTVKVGVGAWPNERAAAVALAPDGKIVAAGPSEDSVNPWEQWWRPASVVTRYHVDGAIDRSFGTKGAVFARQGVTDVVVQPDGRIVTSGGALERFRADGSRDTSFGPDGSGVVAVPNLFHLALQPDGKIVALGTDPAKTVAEDGVCRVPERTGQGSWCHFVTNDESVKIERSDHFVVARFNADGSPDTTFGANPDGRVVVPFGTDHVGAADVAVQGDKIVVLARVAPASARSSDWSGDRFATESGGDFVLVRLLANGVVDDSFGVKGVMRTDVGGDDYPEALAIAPDGSMAAAGTSVGSRSTFGATFGGVFAVARYGRDGLPDPRFGEGGRTTTAVGPYGSAARGVGFQHDGSIVVAGTTVAEGGFFTFRTSFALARYPASGVAQGCEGASSVVTEFPGSQYTQSGMNDVVVQSDGKIVGAGFYRWSYPASGWIALARYHAGDVAAPTFSVGDVLVDEPRAGEGPAKATLQVRLNGAPCRPVSVEWATADDTARAGEDYQARRGQVVFDDEDVENRVTTKTISVPVVADDDVENDERFAVALSNPRFGRPQDTAYAVAGPAPSLAKAQGAITIVDSTPKPSGASRREKDPPTTTTRPPAEPPGVPGAQPAPDAAGPVVPEPAPAHAAAPLPPPQPPMPAPIPSPATQAQAQAQAQAQTQAQSQAQTAQAQAVQAQAQVAAQPGLMAERERQAQVEKARLDARDAAPGSRTYLASGRESAAPHGVVAAWLMAAVAVAVGMGREASKRQAPAVGGPYRRRRRRRRRH